MQQMLMLNSRPQDVYRKQNVLTARPGELIVMLYDGLKKNLVLGRRYIEKRDVQGAHRSLMKAQAIVSELMNSLDMSFEISEELFSLYDFMLWSIREANVKKKPEKLDAVVEMVESLRDAWQQISTSSRGELYAGEEQA